MILKELEKLIDISDDEIEELRNNYFEYEEEIMEILDLYRKYSERLMEKSRLHSILARHTYDIHTTWMELHRSAISLSSYRAEANLRGIPMEKDFFRRMNELIDKYLILEKFT